MRRMFLDMPAYLSTRLMPPGVHRAFIHAPLVNTFPNYFSLPLSLSLHLSLSLSLPLSLFLSLPLFPSFFIEKEREMWNITITLPILPNDSNQDSKWNFPIRKHIRFRSEIDCSSYMRKFSLNELFTQLLIAYTFLLKLISGSYSFALNLFSSYCFSWFYFLFCRIFRLFLSIERGNTVELWIMTYTSRVLFVFFNWDIW